MVDHKSDVYQINQVVVARVSRIFPFGVFVHLADGTQAYIRRRELTQAGNLDPRQVVSEGDEIKAIVVALAGPDQKLELSVRRTEPDPWDTFVQSAQVQDIVTATVTNLSQKGVFVQVLPGIDGFIPLIELAPWAVNQPSDLFWVGDKVEAVITHLDKAHKRLRLSIRHHMKHQALAGKMWEFLKDKETIEEEEEIPNEKGIEHLDTENKDVEEIVAAQLGRILVVDDRDEVRDPLVEWLCRLGFAADGAKSMDQALGHLRKRSYGLALIDMELPGKDGVSFINALDKMAPATKVAIMSDPEQIALRSEELAASGVFDVFVKPLNLDEIHDTLVLLAEGGTPDPLWTPQPELQPIEPQSLFQQLGETMRSGLPVKARFEAGLRELVRFTQAEQGLVFHLAPDSQQVSIVTQVGNLPLKHEAIYVLGDSPVKDVISEGREVFEVRVSREVRSRFKKLLDLLPFESCLGVPIPAGGEVQHALFLFHREANTFARYRLRDAQAMATLFSVALESQALERRIRDVSPFLLSGHLAAGFSHEVYNTMSALEIQLRNLRAKCEHAAKESGVHQSTKHFDFVELGQTTDQLLDVALGLKDLVLLFRELSQAGRNEKVDVNEVVQRAVQLLRPTARRQRVQIEMELASGLPLIIGSAVRLQQVFANLMLNATAHCK